VSAQARLAEHAVGKVAFFATALRLDLAGVQGVLDALGDAPPAQERDVNTLDGQP
jgi:hypothetical protein